MIWNCDLELVMEGRVRSPQVESDMTAFPKATREAALVLLSVLAAAAPAAAQPPTVDVPAVVFRPR